MDLDSIVDAYWEHYRRSDEELFWAWEAVEASMTSDGNAEDQYGVDRIQMLMALADRAPGEKALAYLGAGPVENLLVYHEPNIDRVDEAARRHRSFRTALRCACFDAHIPAADAKHLRRFGPPL